MSWVRTSARQSGPGWKKDDAYDGETTRKADACPSTHRVGETLSPPLGASWSRVGVPARVRGAGQVELRLTAQRGRARGARAGARDVWGCGVPAGCGAVRCRAVGAPRLGCAAPAAGRLRCGFTVRLRAVPLGGRGAVGAERAARSRRAAARAPRLRAPRPADRGARGAVAGAPTYLIACRS